MDRKVLVAVGDMLFNSKIDGAAKQIEGISTKFVKKLDEFLDYARDESPNLIIMDLNNSRFDPLFAINLIKQEEIIKEIPVVGFLSHVQVALRDKAENAGCDQVMPRSEFAAHLSEILAGTYTRNTTKIKD
jgi:CheY-like chemotaxis protein